MLSPWKFVPFLLVVVSFPTCSASIAVVPTAEELFNQSDLVVSGEVVNVESRFGGAAGIYTAVSLRVETIYKGELTSPLIEFSVPGGDIGGIGVWVEDQPTFKLGERPLLFLEYRPEWAKSLHGYSLTGDTFMARSFVDGDYTYGPSGDKFLLPKGRAISDNTAIQLLSEPELLMLASAFIASFALISIPRDRRHGAA